MQVQVEHELKNSCHLEVKGSMFSSDDRLLSVGKETRNTVNDEISSCDISLKDEQHKTIINTVLWFPVEASSFDYIEKLRLESENKDVILKFEFKIVVIEHNIGFDLEKNILTLRNINVSSGQVNLFKVNEYKQNKDWPIAFSDWVNKYKKTLGFGKVFLFEINQPSLDNITNFESTDINVPLFKQRLEKAISTLSIMQDYIRKGEWNQVAEQLRDIELFRADLTNDLKTLLGKTTNLPEDKCQDFTIMLDKLYSLSSQFHHLVRKGKVNEIMNVNKEDAEFFYVIMLSITQLLIKKIEYLRTNTT
ncbi:MAG: hypothetical protein WBZ36_06435 [Candidatus Nitrosopolaris sp.]